MLLRGCGRCRACHNIVMEIADDSPGGNWTHVDHAHLVSRAQDAQVQKWPAADSSCLQQALTGMANARTHDVERGGAYDARSAAINVWSCLWDTPEHRQASELIGTVYIVWNTPHADLTTIIQLNVEQGWKLADVEQHVTLLFGHQGEE
jgi:hypothetical protein